ncbi:hypothetical protein CEP51_011405 [Fusarium floridanum]|uniref:Uncharacterized protein n=1 Tax=Fusarium floridanum TaxID=1325733 RepID=A0A428RBF9_9HYPO|nr:hypothetical protein CEP51_011405 [Fusarium floridanum]
MEAAGAALGTLDLVGGAVKNYRELLRITARSANFVDIQTRVLLERARLETSLRHLSQLQELPPNVMPIFAQLGQIMDKMIESLLEHPPQQEKTSLQRFGLQTFLEVKADMEIYLKTLSELSKFLEATCMGLHPEETRDAIMDLERAKGPRIVLATDHDVQSSERRHHPQEKNKQDANALKELVMRCGLLLKLRGTEDPLFAELSNHFELWRHGLKSERFYQAIALDSRRSLRHDLALLIYRAVLQIGETIAQSWDPDDHGPNQKPQIYEVLGGFASIAIRVREAVQDLDLPPPAEVGGSKDAQKATTIRTLEVVIGTLRGSFPSLVSFSRTCMAVESDIPTAEEVTDLLEASMKLIRLGSEALSRATVVARVQRDKSIALDIESTTEAFNRQTARLEKWTKNHKRDIDTKLAYKSPAKLVSIAGTWERIAYFLNKLPVAVDDLLNSTSASTKSSPDIKSVIAGLETSIQYLVDLEPQLHSIHSLPPFSESSGDCVVVDIISGEVRSVSQNQSPHLAVGT